MNRTTIKITGASGGGLLSTGEILIKTLKKLGYYINADREFPSLIKGGHSCFQIDFSTEPIHSQSNQTDILVAFDEPGIAEYVHTVKKGGIVIHAHEFHHLIKALRENTQEKELKTLFLPALQICTSHGGNWLMTNMVLMGLLWRVLDFDIKLLEEEVSEQFASKPQLLEIDLKCLKDGYQAESIKEIPKIDIPKSESIPKKILINGNDALALGAIQAGVRAYYAYPMSPASSILTYLAKTQHHSEMIVKQAEDEITAAQMSMGSMHVGCRSFVATSGGGFDLMTETISCTAITETPLVVVLVQRPGPGTGLPTWTGQGDLNLAINAGHGEYPRIVMSCSDPTSAYQQIQHALNLAEKYQTLVVLLSDKSIAETQQTIDHFEHAKIPIERGLVTDQKELAELKPEDRYKITETGLSKRWIPGSSPAYYFANGDEHWESGRLTEDGDEVEKIFDKRMRKAKLIAEALPDPEIYGPEKDTEFSFIGWGSTKNIMIDTITAAESKGITVNYLHYEYLWPFKKESANKFFKNNKNVNLIEGNYQGQLGQIIEDKTKNKFTNKHLKFNGRPFYVEEVLSFLSSRTCLPSVTK